MTHIGKRREDLVVALSKFDNEDQRASIKSTFKFFEQLQREHNQVLEALNSKIDEATKVIDKLNHKR